ncbi:MAG: hypothetical protein ABIJ15_06295 [bacterium]
MKSKLFLVLFIGIGVFVSSAGAVGLRTKFGSVRLENVIPGKVYNTRELMNLPFAVTNTSGEDVTGSIVVIKPQPQNCLYGYEPIPDANWVMVSDNEIELRGGGMKVVDVIIRIPDAPENYDRKYLAVIESVARAVHGNIGVGVQSLVYIKTIKSKEQIKEETEKTETNDRLLANMNFEVSPGKIFLFEIKPGRKYEIGEIFGKKLKVVNMNDSAYSYELKSVDGKKDMQPLKGGYERGDPDWITFEKDIIEVPDNTIKVFKAYIKVPKEKKYRGKKYEFYIKTKLLNQKIDVFIYTYVLADVVK